ncbi:MAG TPA: PQQ-dependent sugar dehydrogenase [Acidimicrobiia bacterium]|nr:PQQ-dependent sugar dehydrogenase [Acidimicrobiia bacterium]
MRRSMLVFLVACAVVTTACAAGDPAQTLPEPTIAAAASSTTSAGPGTAAVPSSEATTSIADEPAPTTTSSTTTTTLVPLEQFELTLEEVASGFSAPVFVTSPPDDVRLFVVDQPGIIWVIDGGDPEVFLDIREPVISGGERGLLGLAFDPAFAASGKFYVNYTGSGNATRVSEFTVEGGVADPDSERVLLRIDQPASNHNGGMIAFGPDEQLWIGMGDGGGSNDRYGHGQRPTTLLGSMLRIDPDRGELDDPEGFQYAVPEDNPFVDEGGAGLLEVWAYGLRNPWRFSFDGMDLWIGDVGQNGREEINVIDIATGAGANFGWPRFEGSACYLSSTCNDEGLVAPIVEYPHDEGCSVTGGYVYRGSEIPELTGHYFFGDYCSGWVRSLAPSGEVIEWFGRGTVGGLSSFGVDAAGELYVTALDGSIYRVARTG